MLLKIMDHIFRSQNETLGQLDPHLLNGYAIATAILKAYLSRRGDIRLRTLVKFVLLLDSCSKPLPSGKKLSYLWASLQIMNPELLRILNGTFLDYEGNSMDFRL